MKRSFYLGLLLGALLASGAFSLRQHYAPQVSAGHASKDTGEEPQWWLLPKDFSLSQLYTDPSALFVLDAPDAVTIHRAGPGSIKVLGHYFSTGGITPTPEDAKILRSTFHALNAYSLPSACAFRPGVLLRLTRGEHRLDLLVCFSCEDLAWVLDGRETPSPQAGLSDLGVGTLRSVFRRAFPNDSTFKLP